MDYIEAPNEIDWETVKKPTIFLAGGIIGCPNWQQQIVNDLSFENIEGTLINPRRALFDITDKSAVEIQNKWEYKTLQKVDIVSFWFAKETIQPIVLFELGYYLGKRVHSHHHNQYLTIAVHPEYPRIQDVKYQMINSFEDLEINFDNDTLQVHIEGIHESIKQYNNKIYL